MNNDKCRELIQFYGSYDLLWNSKSPLYQNKALRHDAWTEISRKMGLPILDLKKKMTTLMASYRREKSRIAKSLCTGSAADAVYVSKWFSFEDFASMKDKDAPFETLDTMSENIPTAQTILTEEGDTDPITSQANTEKEDESPRMYKAPDSQRVKKKRKINSEEDSPMLKKAFEVLTESSASSADLYVSYGQYIANELRKYDPRTLVYVKQAINNVIFEADLGKYSNYGYYTQNYVQPSYSSTSSAPSSQPPIPSSQPPTPSSKPPTPSPQPPTPSPQPPTLSPQPPQLLRHIVLMTLIIIFIANLLINYIKISHFRNTWSY